MALVGFTLARRPAVRRVLAIVTISTALLCFATDAYLVAGPARDDRARLETGSEVVLTTDATDPVKFRQTLARMPVGSVTPVAIVAPSGSSAATKTMVVDTTQFPKIAYVVNPTVDWARLRTDAVPVPTLSGNTISVRVRDLKVRLLKSFGASGSKQEQARSEAALARADAPVQLTLTVRGQAASLPMWVSSRGCAGTPP